MNISFQMQTTRQQILGNLQKRGRATVKELGQILGLTSTGIRQHLTVMERDGLVAAREERGRVGRPTLVYSLTEKADSLFPRIYDLLASVMLDEIRASEGNEKLHQLLHRVALRLATPYLDQVNDKPLEQRVAETVRIMEEQGSLVEHGEAGGEFRIDEFTCPFLSVARRDRAVCALHVEFVRILTGADTRLSRSILRGECCCSYRLRPVANASATAK